MRAPPVGHNRTQEAISGTRTISRQECEPHGRALLQPAVRCCGMPYGVETCAQSRARTQNTHSMLSISLTVPTSPGTINSGKNGLFVCCAHSRRRPRAALPGPHRRWPSTARAPAGTGTRQTASAPTRSRMHALAIHGCVQSRPCVEGVERDVLLQSMTLVQMWQGKGRSWCRCGRG